MNLVMGAPASGTEFRLLAIFNATAPIGNDFDATTDYLAGTDKASSAIVFSGSETGNGVASATSKQLWLRLDAPVGNPPAGQQTVTVTVTAVAP